MKKRSFLVFLFILYSGIVLSCTTTTYSGKIAVIGSEPHTFVSLINEDGEIFKITGKYEKKLWENYQNQRVILKGTVIEEAKGPGFPAVLEVNKIVEP